MQFIIYKKLDMRVLITRKRISRNMTIIILIMGLFLSNSALAQPISQKEVKLQMEWRTSMAKIPLPRKGTFEANYPRKEWREIQNTKALPLYPMPPRRGTRPLTVGNGNDISAQAPSGHISSATGSFASVTGVTSESGFSPATNTTVANSYTLQLNTDFFPSTVSGSPAGCQGWEQFIFENDGGATTNSFVYIQYWLIGYGATSPPGSGWTQYMSSGDWYRNSINYSTLPSQPISNLANLSLTGSVNSGGDNWIFSAGGTMVSGTGDNSVSASSGWSIAEFCIVGNCCSSQANFNSGSTIVPKTKIIYGDRLAPNCVVRGFTGETNNLNWSSTAPSASTSGPAVFVTETSTGSGVANCVNATTIGDTHLTTFKGLMYDFQASGDFVLAQVDSDFVVQTRQVSGAPTWPNATVNSAVATRMGKSTISICLMEGLVINNIHTSLDDGKAFSTVDGVDISRRGNVYYITSPNGHSVRATINSSYIDVIVGIGGCCGHKIQGLLANHNDNVNQLESRNGTVLTNPFNFDKFYHEYADSWRVSSKESLLTECGKLIEYGIPGRLFFARDLEQKVFLRARKIAQAVGVKEGPLLDAATLDVAVINSDKAAKVFVDMHSPIAIGRFVGAPYKH